MPSLSTRLARLGLGLVVMLGVAGAVPAHASESPPGGQVLSESTLETDTVAAGGRLQPVYVVPSDLDVHPEYQAAIDRFMAELQGWYKAQVGLTFQVAPVRTVPGSSYDTMRCGATPSPQCLMDRTQVPNWWDAVNALVPWEPLTTKVVFSQGGGGVGGGNLVGRSAGNAIVSDWVLEPISGLRDPRVIHCGYADWQCKGGVPKGTVAHELAHAFGVHHPQDFEPGPLLMRWHGDYPNTGFLPHDKMILRNNPYFDPSAWSAGPWLDYGAPDEMDEGAIVDLAGTDLSSSDRVFFMHATGEIDATISVGTTSTRVRVPSNLGSGMFQARRGTARGNGVPVNVVPRAPGSPSGNLDAVSQNGTGVRFRGWARDPDTSAPVEVHAYVTPQHGVATLANLQRPDVGAHGFDVTRGGIIAGTYNVCAYAINTPGTPGANTELGCRSFTVTQSPYGSLDVVTQDGTGVRFRGWAIDPDTSAPIAVHAYVTPQHAVATLADLQRADVGAEHPASGPAHGFDVTRGGIIAGTYNVCAYAINTPGTPGANTQLGCRSFTVT